MIRNVINSRSVLEINRLYAAVLGPTTAVGGTGAYVNAMTVRHGWGREHKPHKRTSVPSDHKRPFMRGIRRDRVVKINLPDTDTRRLMETDKLSPAEVREELFRRGFVTSRKPPTEASYYVGSTSSIGEEFVPIDTTVTGTRLTAKERLKNLQLTSEHKLKTVRATRKIRLYDEDFSGSTFPAIAHDVYVKAHEACAEQRLDDLHKYATEFAYPEMLKNVKRKTVYWKFIKSLEPARVVQVRTIPQMSKENIFAQVTVRFHTQQVLAVYDRFGRLMHGSPTVAKDVLEYVVFEKHVANHYGLWRVHGKIVPSWMQRDPTSRTYVVDDAEFSEEAVAAAEKSAAAAEARADKLDSTDNDDDVVLFDKSGRPISEASTSEHRQSVDGNRVA